MVLRSQQLRPLLRPLTLLVLAAALWLWPLSARAQSSPSWATERAADLTLQGNHHASLRNWSIARARYTEALSMDGTYGPAYLGLAKICESQGMIQDAMQVYDVALERVSPFVQALLQRARLLERLGRSTDAGIDLLTASRLAPNDPEPQQALVDFYVRQKAWSAALQASRGLLLAIPADADPSKSRVARLRTVALAHLAGSLDPVTTTSSGHPWERKALAAMGRRLGAL